jgi:hypothetical protein
MSVTLSNVFSELMPSDDESPFKETKGTKGQGKKRFKAISREEFSIMIEKENKQKNAKVSTECKRDGCTIQRPSVKTPYCGQRCYSQVQLERLDTQMESNWVKFKTKHPCHGKCGGYTVFTFCGVCKSKHEALNVCETSTCYKKTQYTTCRDCYHQSKTAN